MSLDRSFWVEAEISDLNESHGHCYMDLIQKEERANTPVARAYAKCWRNTWAVLKPFFIKSTGQVPHAGMKMLLQVHADFHENYGFSWIVTDIDPTYSIGDMMQKRRRIIEQLKKEGVFTLNKELPLPLFAQRIAVISAAGAAGYGDFMNQLHTNPSHLRVVTRLFPAIMQGNSAPPSIIAALDQVAAEADQWDCVVIIRGGGATSDLQAFEDYDLAANVAQFPLPVVIGIGHERDITVLDYIANTRLKTPTAVAEWLIAQGESALTWLQNTGQRILQIASQRISGNKEQLAHAEGLLPVLAQGAVERSLTKLRKAAATLDSVSSRRIQPQLTRLQMIAGSIPVSALRAIERQRQLLDSRAELLEALSPHATLARGYSITRVNGRAVTDASQVKPGEVLETTLANGTLRSVAE